MVLSETVLYKTTKGILSWDPLPTLGALLSYFILFYLNTLLFYILKKKSVVGEMGTYLCWQWSLQRILWTQSIRANWYPMA
jgi:hypothetical protein